MNKKYDILLNHESNKKFHDFIKNYRLDGKNEPLTYLPGVSQINIIVGSNNSGKSRFMRYLMSCKNLMGVRNFEIVKESVKRYNSELNTFNKEKIHNEVNRLNTSRSYSTSENQQKKKMVDFLSSNILPEINANELLKISEQIENNNKLFSNLRLKGIDFTGHDILSFINSETVKEIKPSKIYFIPTLRSAHSLFQNTNEKITKIENDIFLETLKKYYNLDSGIDIFTGLHLYKEILNSRNSKRIIRQSFEKFERFISDNFFEKKQVDIVAEFNKDDSLSGKNDSEIISVHIEGEKETRNLYELGDGIQALIILMYKIFLAEDNSFVFIDEPELNLHPGMQRLFLDQISSNNFLKSKNLTYFISTHSNHLLDLTIEKNNVSIYAFSSETNKEEEKNFTIRNVNSGDNSILKNLGVNNSSVFMANCSIWVEGISDRNYLKAFLNSYLESLGDSKNLKEDIDYAFFEYAGSNIEHYFFNESEIEREKIIGNINSFALNNRIFLLADSDVAKKSSKKGQRLKKLEELKRDNFHPYIIWNVREIENLLTKTMWKEILITFCNKEILKNNLILRKHT